MNNTNLVSDVIFLSPAFDVNSIQFNVQTRVKKTQFSIFRKENFFQLT